MKKSLLALAAVLGFSAAAFAGDGTEANPYTVAEVIAKGADYTQTGAYVKGYIVGALPSGAGISMANTIFGATGNIADTNIVLADASAEDDYSYCIPVQLPSGSVRTALNLVSHPENLGYQVLLGGDILKYFGAPAMKNTTSYQWTNGTPEYKEPDAVGTKENPVTVTELLGLACNGAKTWVKGYIVGSIDGGYLSDAKFSADSSVKTNIILAANPAETNIEQCLPVKIPAGDLRDVLTLGNDPSIYGKYVALHGVHEKGFGANGLSGVDEYEWLEGGEIPVTPVTPSYIYKGLASSDEGWELNVDATLEEGLSYVWKWDTNNYLKGSAYVSGDKAATAYAVSPVIDLTDAHEVAVNFEHAAKYQKTLKELCKFVAREEGATDWTELTIPNWPTKDTWNFANSGNIDLSAYEGKKIQLGFLYESSAAGADTWEIRNLVVTGTSGVADIAAENGEAIYFDFQGVRVANPAKGMYIKVQGNKASKVVL